MKKSKIISALIVIASLAAAPMASAQNWGRLLRGGLELLQSFSVSDNQVKGYVSQFIVESDKTNKVAPDNGTYDKRLDKIVAGITSVDGQPLNFKVYITPDINAFACADGSVRVYSGLMDVMTDDEVLGVIGHEIGHVAHHDTREAMKSALRTAALKDALAGTSDKIAVLTDSQLGQLGEAYINARYSRNQESNADEYGYEFLKSHGKNPLVLCLAFRKLGQLENNSSTANLVNQLFSTHPQTSDRISKLEKRALLDGYSYPTASSNGIPGSKKATTAKKTVTSRLMKSRNK